MQPANLNLVIYNNKLDTPGNSLECLLCQISNLESTENTYLLHGGFLFLFLIYIHSLKIVFQICHIIVCLKKYQYVFVTALFLYFHQNNTKFFMVYWYCSSIYSNYCWFQLTFHCNIPNFVVKFASLLQSSKVHFGVCQPVCNQRL